MTEKWIARYGYSVGGASHGFNWFWVRDEYTPNERGNAERFDTRESAAQAARECVQGATVIQPNLALLWRTAVERVGRTQ